MHGHTLWIAAACGLAAAAIGAAPSLAQPLSEKTVRFIVPFPPGGSSDAVARAVQPVMEKVLGQPVVVENRPGAGGTLGVEFITKSPPDGTIFGIAGVGALGINIGETVKRSYDPAKDLALVSRLAASPFVIIATPSLRAANLAETIKLAKAEPSGISIGHGGNGTAMQLAALTFAVMADVKINLVPYRGTAPAVLDVMAGHIALGIADPPPTMGAISEGKLKAIAVTSKQRSAVFPDIPTAHEQGLTDYDVTGWFGVAAPGGTPHDIVMRLNAAVVTALRDPEVAKRIRTIGMEPTPTTPEEFAVFVKAEIAKAEKFASPGK